MALPSSVAECVNFAAVLDLAAAAAATLVPAVASDCCAAAAAAAVAARHAPYVSGRSPQTLRICSGAYVATCVSTEQE